MATAKGRRTTTKSKTAAKKSPAKRSASQRRASQREPLVSMPALGVTIMVVGVLLLICRLSLSNATIIASVRNLLNGAFGKVNVLVILLIILLGLQTALGERWPFRKLAWVQLALLVFCIATVLQVFVRDDILSRLAIERKYLPTYNTLLWKSYQDSRIIAEGGGFIGALLAFPMCNALDVYGSVLVLFCAILAIGFWLVHTVAPSAWQRVAEGFSGFYANLAERRDERMAEREADKVERAQLQVVEGNEALLVQVPPELLEPEAAPPPKRTARGRKQQPSKPEPAPQNDPEPEETYPQPEYVPYNPDMPQDEPYAVDEAYAVQEETPSYSQWENAQQEPPPPPRKSAQPKRPAPKSNASAMPVRQKRTTRLYIEESVPAAQQGNNAGRMPKSAHTDPNAIPASILRRREQMDREYGRLDGRHPYDTDDPVRERESDVPPPQMDEAVTTERPARYIPGMGNVYTLDTQNGNPPPEEPEHTPVSSRAEKASAPWGETIAPSQDDRSQHVVPLYAFEQPADETIPTSYDDNMTYVPASDEETLYAEESYADDPYQAEPYGDEPYEEDGYQAAPEAPAPPARQKPQNSYTLQGSLDREPRLDPETRLDRPDWKPPEPEVVKPVAVLQPYRHPPLSLLLRDEQRTMVDTREEDARGAKKLEETLASFGVSAHVIRVVHGPAVTRYELQPAPGVKVSKIVSLTDDIALNMAAVGVRIEAPIPGKAAIGIEIANDSIQTVLLRDVLEGEESRRNPSKLAVALGKDIAGKRIIADLARMPHLLIAGATGSGKSVCINTLITSIIYRATPEEVRMILIDPKKVELAVYNGIPHLLVPVVTDPKKASGALAWAVMEMDERYRLFADIGVRDIRGYNNHRGEDIPLMPQIVVVIDELSDLMLVAPGEVEESICRLAQLARACGIHLVIATQRPSVNVITGIIKANIPSRIAFAVSSNVDSRTILDSAGAEKLLGKGDMLYAPSGGGKPMRVQGCFVSDEEVSRVVSFVKERHETEYSQAVIEALDAGTAPALPEDDDSTGDNVDELFEQAVEMAIDSGQASISMFQRKLRVGYARAGRIIDEMARREIITKAEGAKPREVLMTREEFRVMFNK